MTAHDPLAPLFADGRDVSLEMLAELIREEVAALLETLPDAYARQWTASPVPRPREDTNERAKGPHSDPTPSIALDGRRLALRDQVVASEHVLRSAAVAVRGVRRGLERALDRWDGAAPEEGISGS